MNKQRCIDPALPKQVAPAVISILVNVSIQSFFEIFLDGIYLRIVVSRGWFVVVVHKKHNCVTASIKYATFLHNSGAFYVRDMT